MAAGWRCLARTSGFCGPIPQRCRWSCTVVRPSRLPNRRAISSPAAAPGWSTSRTAARVDRGSARRSTPGSVGPRRRSRSLGRDAATLACRRAHPPRPARGGASPSCSRSGGGRPPSAPPGPGAGPAARSGTKPGAAAPPAPPDRCGGSLVLARHEPGRDSAHRQIYSGEISISEYNGGRKSIIGLNDLPTMAMGKTLGLLAVSMEHFIRDSTSKSRPIPSICALEGFQHLTFSDFLQVDETKL